MADLEPFTLIEETSSSHLYDTFQDCVSAKTADHDIQYLTALRKLFPELIVTTIPANTCSLLAFAASGHAVAELDIKNDSFAAWRGWVPAIGGNEKGGIGQTTFFAKYHYRWGTEDFVLYIVGGLQYILKEPRGGETMLSPSKTTDDLITVVGTWQSADLDIIWVYDNYWTKSKSLWEQVQKAEWENVILDEDMKKGLTDVSTRFFDGKSVYDDLGVPWKRGLIFYGPPGNGKTISIKALMHTLLRHRPKPIPTLYVKSAPNVFHIKNVFALARRLSPCLLVLEDIETIVTPATRSYFFNEVDGLENNDGILMVASTNYLERLDPGLAKRPSRFDRKYLFPMPSEHERTLYAQFWRHKLRNKPSIEFPSRLCPAIAKITDGFSFAYMQEAFIATLLVIARDVDVEAVGEEKKTQDDDGGIGGLLLWKVFQEQVKILREDMDGSGVDDAGPVGVPSATADSAAHHQVDALASGAQSLTLGEVSSGLAREVQDAMVDLMAFGPVGFKRNFISTAAFDAHI